MNAPRLTDAQVSQALRAHLPERAQAGLRERILEAAETTTQQRALPSFLGALSEADPVTRRRSLLIAAALLVALALAATAAVGALRSLERDPFHLSLEPPTDTVVTTLPPPSAEPAAPTSSSEVSPPPVGQSLELAWTKVTLDQRSPQVAWLGDQFVLIDEDSGAVFTSTDGFSWHALQPGDPDPGYLELMRPRHIGAYVSWQDQIVGWWNPEDGPDIGGKPPITARDIIRIVRPGAAPTDTTPFKGRIGSLGIGPAGIVATVDSQLDFDAWVTKKLGLRTNNDWTCCVKDVTFQNGVLQIKLNNGPGLKVNWADEGFLPGDYLYTGFGWYSPDGVQWTPIPGYGTDFTLGQVIGVSDGFIAQGEADEDRCPLPDGCGEMWHSSDVRRTFGRRPEVAPRQTGANGAVDGWRARHRRACRRPSRSVVYGCQLFDRCAELLIVGANTLDKRQ